jgi:hypothetical protein
MIDEPGGQLVAEHGFRKDRSSDCCVTGWRLEYDRYGGELKLRSCLRRELVLFDGGTGVRSSAVRADLPCGDSERAADADERDRERDESCRLDLS